MKILICLLLCFNLFAATKTKIIAPPKFGLRPKTIVYLPSKYSENIPLVILLHGHGANGAIENFYLPFKNLVDEMNFIIASPSGTKDSEGHRFWNDRLLKLDFLHKEKGIAQPNTDDIEFLTNLIETLKGRYPVDPKRIYLIGHSNGGFMSYRYACLPKSQIAAVAVLAGSVSSQLECHRDFSILHIHGTKDNIIKYEGNDEYYSVKDTVNFWKEHAQCTNQPDTRKRDNLLTFRFGDDTTKSCWDQCRNRKKLCLYQLHQAGHTPIFKRQFKEKVLNFLFSN